MSVSGMPSQRSSTPSPGAASVSRKCRRGTQCERLRPARRLAPGGVCRLVGRRIQPQPAPAEGIASGLGQGLTQARAKPLAVDLHHPAGGDAEHAMGGPVGLECTPERGKLGRAVAGAAAAREVDRDQPAEIAQDDFAPGGAGGLGCGGIGGLARVHVDRAERAGFLDREPGAAGQRDLGLERSREPARAIVALEERPCRRCRAGV